MFDKIFGPVDKMGYTGFIIMWFCFFFTSFGVMLGDSTTGPARDFCAVSQMICCTNLVAFGYAITNNIPWSKASMLTCALDMCVTWTALAYFGGNVFGTSAIGIFNYIQVPMMAIMTIPTLLGLIVVARDPEGFRQYLENGNQEATQNDA